MSYLRNSIAYDLDFWCTCVKWWYLEGLFLIFFKFSCFRLLGGKRAKDGPRWQKNSGCTSYLRNHISYDCHLWYTWVKWYLQDVFFFFSKFWFPELLEVERRAWRAKMVQNEKKFCLSCSISLESYIIWFSFIVLMCKMIIPRGDFFIFSKFRFSRLLLGW